MLNDAVCFKQVYIVTGYNDLRSGIDRLAALITSKIGDNPFVPETLYLFLVLFNAFLAFAIAFISALFLLST